MQVLVTGATGLIGAAVVGRLIAEGHAVEGIARMCIGLRGVSRKYFPRLWIEPLGPMMKFWPILVLHLMALAIVEDR